MVGWLPPTLTAAVTAANRAGVASDARRLTLPPMLERVTASNGVVFYRSPLLREAGIAHAFSTRVGGVSRGVFASLNLGNPPAPAEKDPWENVLANHRRVHDAIGLNPRQRLSVHQVHGCGVVTFRGGDWPEPQPSGDAIVTDDPTVVASVRVADCVPVLLASGDGRVVAAVHAGWRGVVAGVVPRAIEAMRSLGVEPDRLVAAIGAGISPEHFEVGPEVLDAFGAAFGPDAPIVSIRPDGKGFIDLQRGIVTQLTRAGVRPDRIDTTDRCTVRDADEFFSHRRDRGQTGRMSAFIAARPSRGTR
jgi:YfiH family protein